MVYKENCGFKEHLNVCNFKEEDCNSEKCDMYDIEWDKDKILLKIQDEKAEIKRLMGLKKDMKKSGQHKEDKKGFKQILSDLSDKVYGMMYLSKAYDYLSGGKYSKMSDSRVGKRLINKVKKQAKKQADNDTGSE